MTARLALLGACALLAATACDDDYGGYYWWDETNDVWCYTYSDGVTECDTPNDDDDGDPTPSDSNSTDPGDSEPTDSDDSDAADPTPSDPTPGDDDPAGLQCTTLEDGSRHCIVVDGDHVCEFTYGADGTITGACAEINDPDGETRSDCERTNAGGLFCQFQDEAGTQCVAIFDVHGVVEYDSCDYFEDAEDPT